MLFRFRLDSLLSVIGSMSSNATKYNPNQLSGNKCFNTQSTCDFEDITDAERDRALDELDDLVETTRDNLGE